MCTHICFPVHFPGSLIPVPSNSKWGAASVQGLQLDEGLQESSVPLPQPICPQVLMAKSAVPSPMSPWDQDMWTQLGYSTSVPWCRSRLPQWSCPFQPQLATGSGGFQLCSSPGTLSSVTDPVRVYRSPQAEAAHPSCAQRVTD